MATAYHSNIEDLTLKNTNFRTVLFTASHMQLVVMSLKPGEDIGQEVHPDVDQFFRLEAGEAKFIVDQEEFQLFENDVCIIPAGSQHNIINTSADLDLKLYTIYSPPNHPDGTIHVTKQEAEEYEHQQHQ